MLAALLALAGPAGGAEVWKWRDAQGVTHYGPAPPEDARTRAERIDLPDSSVTDADRRAAEKRLAHDEAEVRRATQEPATARSRRPQAARAASAAAAEPSCEEAWRRYDESYACFDPYRFGAGKIRPEAFQHCQEVPQPPALCR
jgi:hypothetical protein